MNLQMQKPTRGLGILDEVFVRVLRGKRDVRIASTAGAPVISGASIRCLGAFVFALSLAACSGGLRAQVAEAPALATGSTPAANGPLEMMPARSLDVSGFVAEVDADKNGCMSRDEWVKAGAPTAVYDMQKNDRGCVTHERMYNEPAPVGIDGNGDGKLTLAELQEFDRKMASAMQGKQPAQ